MSLTPCVVTPHKSSVTSVVNVIVIWHCTLGQCNMSHEMYQKNISNLPITHKGTLLLPSIPTHLHFSCTWRLAGSFAKLLHSFTNFISTVSLKSYNISYFFFLHKNVSSITMQVCWTLHLSEIRCELKLLE